MNRGGTLTGYSKGIKSVAFRSGGGGVLAVGDKDMTLQLWDTDTWDTSADVRGA